MKDSQESQKTKKKISTTQQGYQDISDDDDEMDEQDHNTPQANTDGNGLLKRKILEDDFLQWDQQKKNSPQRIRSAHTMENIQYAPQNVVQKSFFEHNFNFNGQQNPQHHSQQQQRQPLQQYQQFQMPYQLQPQQQGFSVVEYFQQQGKNVQQWMIDQRELQLGRQIGTGSSCDVFIGRWRGNEVAIKRMKIKALTEGHLKEFQREISALISISPHINLVQLMGISQSEDVLYIVMEYCSGGTLFDLLHRKKSIQLDWPVRIKIALQIAQGMQHLHKLNPPLIHRDLKTLNLLLENPFDLNRIVIKIADFGLARLQAPENELMSAMLGTFHWMAPEVFENQPYSIKVDIYSYGIVLWEICCRETPYKNFQNQAAIMRFVCDKGRPDLGLLQQGCPNVLKDLMIRCWDHDAIKRPLFSDIIARLQAQ